MLTRAQLYFSYFLCITKVKVSGIFRNNCSGSQEIGIGRTGADPLFGNGHRFQAQRHRASRVSLLLLQTNQVGQGI